MGDRAIGTISCDGVLQGLGREDLIDHPKFKTNPLRCDHRKEMVAILEKEM